MGVITPALAPLQRSYEVVASPFLKMFSASEKIAILHVTSQISKAFAPENIAIPCASKSRISIASAQGEIAFEDCVMPLDLSCLHSEASGLNDSSETFKKTKLKVVT